MSILESMFDGLVVFVGKSVSLSIAPLDGNVLNDMIVVITIIKLFIANKVFIGIFETLGVYLIFISHPARLEFAHFLYSLL
jgi:hypothetical protein